MTRYQLLESYETGFFQVDQTHHIYYEICGNPNGNPVIILHGGPGSHHHNMSEYFNPEKYKIVMFDQRGSGKSTPKNCIINNTIWDLIEDIEKLRKFLSINTWIIFGSSWGTTLSICYSIKYPDNIKGLILSNIFIPSCEDKTWNISLSYIFPDAWEKYTSIIPNSEKHNIENAYNNRLISDDNIIKYEAIKSFFIWNFTINSLSHTNSNKEYIENNIDNICNTLDYTIYVHYSKNNYFLQDNWIFENINKINHIPTTIIHGRYDMTYPLIHAWTLYKYLPNAEFYISNTAGHSFKDTGIKSKIIKTSDKYSNL